jgi:hypothetical protein
VYIVFYEQLAISQYNSRDCKSCVMARVVQCRRFIDCLTVDDFSLFLENKWCFMNYSCAEVTYTIIHNEDEDEMEPWLHEIFIRRFLSQFYQLNHHPSINTNYD